MTQTALHIYCIIVFCALCIFCLSVSTSECFLCGYVWGVFLILNKVSGSSVPSIMLVHYQINQWPAGLPELWMLKYEAPWEPLAPVPMETGCCISLNGEHLKTGLCGRSPGMQDNEWLISVRGTSLHVQTHTPLASGPEQVGDANRCCKDSVASFSFTKTCFLFLLALREWKWCSQ